MEDITNDRTCSSGHDFEQKPSSGNVKLQNNEMGMYSDKQKRCTYKNVLILVIGSKLNLHQWDTA